MPRAHSNKYGTIGGPQQRQDEDLSQFGEGLSAGIDTTMGTLGGVRSLFNSITGDEEEAIEYLVMKEDDIIAVLNK